MVLHQWPKNKMKTLKTPTCEIFVFDVLLWGLHPHTFSHLAHIITVTLKPSTPENRTSLLHHVLNPVLKCSFLQCFSNINQICPQNRPLTKMITLHNAQNKTGCFRNGLLWKMKTFMLTKTHNWKNEKTKLRKGFWKTKQNRKPQKTKIIDEKKPFKCEILSWNKHKETRQKKQQKNKEGENQQESKEKTKKTRNKIERDREWKRKSDKTKEKERETLRNEQNNPFSGEKQCFCKRQKTQNTKKGWRPTGPKHTCRVFLLSLRSLHGHVSSSYALFIAKVSLIFFFYFGVLLFFFLVVVFRFLFPCLSLLCVLQVRFCCFFFCILLCDQKSRSNHRISEMFILMFCFGACILAFSLGPAKTPTRTREAPLQIVFDSFLWFLTMCWNTYFYSVSWTSTRISPIKMGPKENDNLSQCVKPKLGIIGNIDVHQHTQAK